MHHYLMVEQVEQDLLLLIQFLDQQPLVMELQDQYHQQDILQVVVGEIQIQVNQPLVMEQVEQVVVEMHIIRHLVEQLMVQ